MRELLKQYGFEFMGMCGACTERKEVWKNSTVPYCEIKISRNANYFQIYDRNAQTNYGNSQEILENHLKELTHQTA